MDASVGRVARSGAINRETPCLTRLRALIGRAAAWLALVGCVVASQVMAQGSTDCVGAATLCAGKCAGTGALGGLLGGNARASQAQCRSACEQERVACERSRQPGAPSPSAAAPEVRSGQRPADAGAPAGREPTTAGEGQGAMAGSGESVVLMTVKPKDPFGPAAGKIPVAYVQQALTAAEAKRHMRPHWAGPAGQHHADAGVFLVTYGGPLMTRRKFVEATLSAYEKAGGQRGNVRIDALSAGPAVESRSNAAAAAAPRARPATIGPQGRPTRQDTECVKRSLSPRRDARGNPSYTYFRNLCDGPVTIAAHGATAGAGACTLSVLRQGEEREYYSAPATCLHAASVSADQAMRAHDEAMRADSGMCRSQRCPTGTRLLPFFYNAPAATTAR